MRIILDVSADVGNRIEGTASWANSGKPIQFSGWLALMLLLEKANPGRPDGGQPAALSDRAGHQQAGGSGVDP